MDAFFNKVRDTTLSGIKKQGEHRLLSRVKKDEVGQGYTRCGCLMWYACHQSQIRSKRHLGEWDKPP